MATPEQKKENRQEGINRIHEYLGGRCVKCFTEENLHIDHIKPESKLYNPSQHYYLPWIKLVQELDKCQLLCQYHHLEKSKADGSKVRGSKIGTSKLSFNQVQLIRAKCETGQSQASVARELNISRQNVNLIVKRKIWRQDEDDS